MTPVIQSLFIPLLLIILQGQNVTTTSSSPTTPSQTLLSVATTTPMTPPLAPPPNSSPVRNYEWVIALIVLSSLGILAVLAIQLYVIVKIFFTKGSAPPRKPWRAHWLGQTLLCGIFCSYATCFAFLPYRYFFIPAVQVCYFIIPAVGYRYFFIPAITGISSFLPYSYFFIPAVQVFLHSCRIGISSGSLVSFCQTWLFFEFHIIL